MQQVDLGNGFALLQKRVEGKGDDLRLTAKGGDQNGFCHTRFP